RETAPVAAAAAVVNAAPAAQSAGSDAEGAPRKRRRRRRGRSVEGAEANQQPAGGATNGSAGAVAPSGAREAKARPARGSGTPAPQAAPVPAARDKSSSLISRLGSGLKKLVTRAPRPQH